MIGQKFGRWTVLARNGSVRYSTYTVPMWICRCECGTEKNVSGKSLRNKGTLSCGCLNDEIIRSQGTKSEEMVGKKFGRWVVLNQVFRPGRTGTLWLCRCECGTEKTVKVMELKKGNSTSCGCYREEIRNTLHKSHGMANNPLYKTWVAMHGRCYNHKNKQYKDYGGRGITVCERWHDVRNFIEDMGGKPNKNFSIERIDNEKGYSPENCRWADVFEQKQNTRRKPSTGIVGVSYVKPRRKYSAYISVDKKQISLGVFENIQDAIEARKAAEVKYLGRSL